MTLKPSGRTPKQIDVFVVGRREPPIEAAEAFKDFFLISNEAAER